MIGFARVRVAKRERKNATAVAHCIRRGKKAVWKCKNHFLKVRKKDEEEGK
jgi:hypothetical protein